MERFAIERDVVEVAGPDAATYLQGQLSQDVAGLALGGSAWSFVLQPTGKVDVLVRVWRTAADRFVLDTDPGSGDALVARLDRFKLRTNADIARLEGWRAVAVRGDDAGERPDGAVIGWPTVPGWDVIGPDPGEAGGDPVRYEQLRIEARWPAMGRELDADTVPGESGIVPHTASFTKGCYTGQELVARIDSRGNHVPTHLRLVTGAVQPGDKLLDDGHPVGTVTSAAGGVALAYVSRRVEPPATLVTAGGATVGVS